MPIGMGPRNMEGFRLQDVRIRGAGMPMTQMISRAVKSWFLPTVLLCGFGFCGAAATELPPQPADGPIQVGLETRSVQIRNSESVLEYPDWLTTVKSYDSTVIRISAVRPNQIRVQRIAPGTTTLVATDRADHQYSIEVVVHDAGDGR